MASQQEQEFLQGMVQITDLDFAKGKVVARFEEEAPESEDLDHLVRSIKKHGVIEPLIVRPKGMKDGRPRYEVMAGNRRLRAAKIAKVQSVPVIVKDYDDVKGRRIAYIENVMRKDLNSIQKAKGIAAIYNDIGIKKETAIQKVNYLRNHPEYLTKGHLGTSVPLPSNQNNEISMNARPTPEFLEAFEEIGYAANYQYHMLLLITSLPPEAQEILEDIPRFDANRAVKLTHSRLEKYPEVKTLLAGRIKERIDDGENMSQNKVDGMVSQAVHDLDTGYMTVVPDKETGKRHVTFGLGGREYVTEKPEIDKTFDVKIPDIAGSIMKLIGQILERRLRTGEIMYELEKIKPDLDKLEKNLRSVKRNDKDFLVSQAMILMRICKIIMDSR